MIDVPHDVASACLPSLREGEVTQGALHILAASASLVSELMGLDPSHPGMSEATLTETATVSLLVERV